MSEEQESKPEKQKIKVDPNRQSLVLEQRYRLYDSFIEANSNMDGHINNITQSSSIIIGLVTVLNFPQISGTIEAIKNGGFV